MDNRRVHPRRGGGGPPAARAKQHMLFTEAPLGMAVWADKKRVQQVLANLIATP